MYNLGIYISDMTSRESRKPRLNQKYFNNELDSCVLNEEQIDRESLNLSKPTMTIILSAFEPGIFLFGINGINMFWILDIAVLNKWM